VGSGDQWSGPRDLRLSFGDASQHTRSVSHLAAAPSHRRDLAASPRRHLRSGRDRDSSLGVVNVRPSIDMRAQRPLPVTSSLRRAACSARPRRALGFAGRGRDLRPGVATLRTRSALAVPPGYDGFLRWVRCRFVAPCSRPWGSPRCRTDGSAPHGGVARTSPHARPAGPPREGLAGRRRFPLTFRSSEEETSGSRWQLRLAHLRVHSRWRYTLRSFSLASSRATSPWPLPSRRWNAAPTHPFATFSRGCGRGVHLGGLVDLRALLHWRVRSARPALPPNEHPMLPWAFAPSRVSDSRCSSHPPAGQSAPRRWLVMGEESRCAVSDQVGPGPANRDRERSSYSGLVAFLRAAGANARPVDPTRRCHSRRSCRSEPRAVKRVAGSAGPPRPATGLQHVGPWPVPPASVPPPTRGWRRP
jgi:hypothetical protein